MKRVFSSIYYHFYSFYKDIFRDSEPHLLARLVISTCCGSLIVLPFYYYYAMTYCAIVNKWFAISIFIITYCIIHARIHKTGKDKLIVKKPVYLFNNRILSIAFSLLFFIITAGGYFFLGPVLIKDILDNCR